MSHWDFGRPPAEHHDAPYDVGPDAGPDSGSQAGGYPTGTLGDDDGEWWPDAGGDWWPDGGDRPATSDPFSAGYADSDAELDAGDWDEELGPYPVTYERVGADTDADGTEWGHEEPASGAPADTGEPWPPSSYAGAPGDSAAGADAGAAGHAAFAGGAGRAPREPWTPGGTAASAARRPWTPGGTAPDLTAAPGPAPTGVPATGTAAWAMSASATATAGDEEWADWDLDAPAPGRSGRGGRRSRWLIPAGVAVAAAAVGAGAVALTAPHGAGAPASQPGSAAAAPARSSAAARSPAAAGPSPQGTPSPTASSGGTAGGAPLTLAQAQAVLAGYTAANNRANAQRSAARLAAIETGSSLAIDSALYQAQRAAGAAPYPPFSPLKATYYLPGGEAATGPRWFAVQVANAFQSSPGTVSSTEYLLFTQSAPGAPWRDAIEPYLVPGAAAPAVALDADGLATAVALDATTAAVAPGQLPAATAASLDAAGGQAGITAPGTLADLADQRFWRSKLPGGQVTDVHAPAAGASGQAFALRTADGGALVFYTDTARLTITPPTGSMLHLTIPGFFTPGQALAQANVGYLDQFAAYDPPSGSGPPRIVADYAAVTGAGTG